MTRLAAALRELQQERARAMHEIKRMDEAIAVLGKFVARNGAKPSGNAAAKGKRRVMSAAARRRIAVAQKARWAKWKAAQAKKAA